MTPQLPPSSLAPPSDSTNANTNDSAGGTGMTCSLSLDTLSNNKQQHAFTSSSITAALAPMVAIGSPHHSLYPFSIPALRSDDGTFDKKSKRRSFRGRSLSPFRFGHKRSSSATSRSRLAVDDEGLSDNESIASSSGSGITPRNNAFDIEEDEDTVVIHSHHHSRNDSSSPSSSHVESETDTKQQQQEEEDEKEDDFHNDLDPVVLDNTLYNAGCLDLHENWIDSSGKQHKIETYQDENLEKDDEHITAPNVVIAQEPFLQLQRRHSKVLSLNVSRPVFERDRCTITLIHGDYQEAATAAQQTKRPPKRYIVASDGSEESSFAIEWTIGTVLRDGNEMLVVSVMETDTKLDSHESSQQDSSTSRRENQRTRQAMSSILAKQATHLLQRTRLQVKISCQAIHAKNSRHMLLDLIDFYNPTMVIVGSRGLGSLRGILLGSTSHYLVQKSSAPVMVARKRLKLPALPKGKSDVVQSVRLKHMRLDQAAVEKKSNSNDQEDDDKEKEEEGETNQQNDKEKGEVDEPETRDEIQLTKLQALSLHEQQRQPLTSSPPPPLTKDTMDQEEQEQEEQVPSRGRKSTR